MDVSKNLTPRLRMVCELLLPCECVADIGTDHAYVPIFLVQKKLCRRAIACDTAKGPLAAARANIAKFGVKDVSVRESDGFSQILPNEADAAILAGMGGDLIVRIMASPTVSTFQQIIIQPQRAPALIRRSLHQNGFLIDREALCRENDRFYCAFRAVRGSEREWTMAQYELGKRLIEDKHPLLASYAAHKIKKLSEALSHMPQEHENYAEYIELKHSLEDFL
ncbi:MAG: class I SAM-dependent methyltransferase [Clostridia bacterium]|nr:class I SAM-dependent methyltransferase [Clostridia bacterium]